MDMQSFYFGLATGFAVSLILLMAAYNIHRLSGPVPAEWGPPQGTVPEVTDTISPALETPGTTRHSLTPTPASRSTPKQMLLITGCKDPLMWYADKVGSLVPYEGKWHGDGYKSREPAGYINIVKFEDAEITLVGGV